METLSHGFTKLENGDKGQPVFDTINENIQKTNDHTHDGVDAPKVSVASISKLTQDVLSTGWTDPVDGLYSQIVAMVGGLQFNTTTITIRETSTGKLMSLPYIKVTDTSIRVYCNDASKNITIIYA